MGSGRPSGGYSTLAADATYGSRMRTHARHAFRGAYAATFPEPPFDDSGPA